MMTQHNWGWTKTSGAGNRSQDIPAPRKFDRFRESLGESDGRKVPCGRSDEESGRRSKDQGGMTWLYEEKLTSFMTSMFLLLICSVFIYQNFLKPEFPKTRVPKNMVGHCILFSFKNGCFGSSPGFLGLQYPPQFHIMARNSLQSQRATEESSAVEIKELHKSLEKAKREAWMKFICFFMSVFRDDDGCRNFIYFMNMYRYDMLTFFGASQSP